MSREDRRRVLLDAAEGVFLGRGYHDATMDDVAQAASMSKKTVYQIVGSKAELFEGMLAERFLPPVPAFDEPASAMKPVLTGLLRDMVQACLSPRHLALMRLMIAEAPRSREMADALDRLIGNGAIEQWMERQVALGRLTARQVEGAGGRLFFSVAGEALLHRLLGIGAPFDTETAERKIEEAVDGFLPDPVSPARDPSAPPPAE